MCNCDTRRHPRGAKGVGCSCQHRDAIVGELLMLKDAIETLREPLRQWDEYGDPGGKLAEAVRAILTQRESR